MTPNEEKERHMIITLCGSARFEPFYKAWNEALTLAGHTVFTLTVYPSDKGGKKEWYTQEEKAELDRAHFRKIDASDAILVLNAFAYIGESTLNEIEHAKTTGKHVYYLESWGRELGVSSMHSTEYRAKAISFGLQLPTRSPIDTTGFEHDAQASYLFGSYGHQRYRLNELVDAAYQGRAALRAESEPVAYQFYENGKWHNFINEAHRRNTEAAGYPIRELYTAPQTLPIVEREEP